MLCSLVRPVTFQLSPSGGNCVIQFWVKLDKHLREKRNKTCGKFQQRTNMSLFLVLVFLIPVVLTSDSKPMDGLNCRQVTPAQQLCTGKNEDYAIGFFNVRQIATVKFRKRKKPSLEKCNSTYVIKDETLLPSLMHDGYGRLRFVFQDEENNKTQAIRLVTCKPNCSSDNKNATVTPIFTRYDFVSWDPLYNYFDPEIVAFNLPSCCKCVPKE